MFQLLVQNWFSHLPYMASFTFIRKIMAAQSKMTLWWNFKAEATQDIDQGLLPTGMLRPSTACMAASWRASFLVEQYFMDLNIWPFTKHCAPKPPSTPGASLYLGRLILFFWQYRFRILTKSMKLPGKNKTHRRKNLLCKAHLRHKLPTLSLHFTKQQAHLKC